jgi:predicted nucleic acid-binding protein
MRLLVDSCVWSLSLRRKHGAVLSKDEQSMVAALNEGIRSGRVVIIGPIRQEILSDLRKPAQFERLRSSLDAFPDEPLTTSHYEEAARLFNLCRGNGVQCGPIDMLICAVALENNWSVLTNDEGLKRCLELLQSTRAPHP